MFVLISQNTFALETPHGGHFDSRVKHINYNQQQVVKLIGHYGFSTDIAFDATESIKQIAMGDADAWSVTPVDNHIFIKPKAELAITNMTVLTSKHVYNFELSAHWSKNGAHPHPNDMMFAVQFQYPNGNKQQQLLKEEKQQLQKQLSSTAKPQVKNQNYFYKGDESILPMQAFDDGRFTYLTFSQKQDLPTVYTVATDNSESIVNSHINPHFPNTLVVQRVVKQLVLRRGNTVLCLFNKGFATETAAKYQTTVIPKIKRKLKGGKHGA
ncbi:P-type conjugative transfer protein VirB9 [Parashewanella spongiae]|uniref:P-type conjugative transfer protein VirB9 n=2 Tax=Parashewanella spongiae TaxID=342950 RepID=A0A3A6TCQ1_9GAMM|nr:P-type conjugative transfer protein VirB9 [Parashewanella spongiae]